MQFFAEKQIKMGVFYDVAVVLVSNRLHNVLPRRVGWSSQDWDVS
ncbi:MAG: hypothetical protein HW416_3795 [Chloroflexi bacterium]|nr:hypothetical protein [Chloroflexota bacterium]